MNTEKCGPRVLHERKEERKRLRASTVRVSPLSQSARLSIYLSAYYVRLGLFTVDAYKHFLSLSFPRAIRFRILFSRSGAKRYTRRCDRIRDPRLEVAMETRERKRETTLPRHDQWTGSSPPGNELNNSSFCT